MGTKEGLMRTVSQLRQRRYYAERRCEGIGKMLSACLVFRARTKGVREFRSLKAMKGYAEYKNYAYLTCYYKGRNWYKYIRKEEVEGIKKLTENYRMFSQRIAEVRSLNKRIVELLEEIGQIQAEEVRGYVQGRVKGIGKKE